MKKIVYISLVIVLIVLTGLMSRSNIMSGNSQSTTLVRVVAAENFYGDIVKQLGGNKVRVVSILSDPNADPHEYESSIQDAEDVSNANIVIENGLGYDAWMDKLISASPNQKRIVLIGGKLASHPLPDNPHVWYSLDNVQTIAGDITNSLKKEDPADSYLFSKNMISFDESLKPLKEKIADIKNKFQGTHVGLTETIYLYQTQPEGLIVLTPLSFEKAIAEGNDPSVQDVAVADDQITNKQVKILIYNDQTITPVTTNMQNEARKLDIPIVPVWETMPYGLHYQSWMMGQLNNLEIALQKAS